MPILSSMNRNSKFVKKINMSDANEAKKKALQLTLDKLDKTYGRGAVMKLGDEAIEEVESISSGSIGLDLALGVEDIPAVVAEYTVLSPQERPPLPFMQ